jgi:pantetheine-phosphate adenylyltransferase
MRLEMLRATFAEYPQIEIDSYEKLTVDYCRRKGASFIIRGLRNASDFDYEKTISQINNVLGDGLETVFLIAKPGMSHVSSTIVREIFKGGGDVSPFVPKAIEGLLKSHLKPKDV